ncbi:aspartyl-phosphate phosphatase Spo0E family protein [Aquibacillus rhizosphaerae]|uniref:Aspartyl-phosphate phosphatase Spo0E family protein n=1 Tax=Aquibacillus rhizosphaerae TaxID=3051431 RepID=A0ABT7LAB8_9BACI|nr:aspartyl-phosphate phosphatase Spo0E family protein [Aquibacillus sp. LR5S19]MDL4842816.1 aspartyl-phosphate phosphatase Spo0E family protein [Aquibacillus sp. LR5S19]
MKNLSIKIIFIKFEIYILRNHMIYSGKKKGLTHPETIKSSQALDTALNKYQRVS